MSKHKTRCPYCMNYSPIQQDRIRFSMLPEQKSKVIGCPICKNVFGVHIKNNKITVLELKQPNLSPQRPVKEKINQEIDLFSVGCFNCHNPLCVANGGKINFTCEKK